MGTPQSSHLDSSYVREPRTAVDRHGARSWRPVWSRSPSTADAPVATASSGEKHRGQYLTYKQEGKTRTVYVPVDLRRGGGTNGSKNTAGSSTLMQELSALSVARVRTHVRNRRQRAGRS